jgi:RNA polymerase sigma-70 factor (ECF subfamily)
VLVDDVPVEAAEALEDERQQQAQAACRLLDELPREQRRAVVLTKIEGRPVVEAATILGVTPGAVKLRAHRAYKTLRAKLLELQA